LPVATIDGRGDDQMTAPPGPAGPWLERQERPGMDWRSKAVCGDAWAWLFFGPDGERPAERASREAEAKAICASCPVRAECLDYALSHGVRYGVWGGRNEEERFRERLRRARKPDAARR
jgi:WhiB family transcriptional regulator, redox-sensing transcriptional regulator